MNTYKTLLEKWNAVAKKWKEEIKADIFELVEKVKTHEVNKNIYAFIVDVRVGHYYSVIGINNEKSWEEFLEQSNCSPGSLNGIYGRKYGVDDFRVRWEGSEKLSDIGVEVNEVVDEMYDVYEYNDELSDAEKKKIKEMYYNTSYLMMELYIECLKELMPHIRTLNITENFVAYVVGLWDLSEEENTNYMLQTVPKELAEQIFTPVTEIHSLSLESNDMEGRLAAIRKYHLGSENDSIISKELLETYLTDLINNRPANNKLIIDEILWCINEAEEKHGEMHYISLFEKEGGYLQFLSHYFYELSDLEELELPLLDKIQKMFYSVCKNGYKKVEGERTMSIVPEYLARLLHQHKGDRYPQTKECISTFFLENYEEYLKGIEE